MRPTTAGLRIAMQAGPSRPTSKAYSSVSSRFSEIKTVVRQLHLFVERRYDQPAGPILAIVARTRLCIGMSQRNVVDSCVKH